MNSTSFKVVIAGASGLIGSALTTALLNDGHRVIKLTRRNAGQWNPEDNFVDLELLQDADVVVNLAGENIAGTDMLNLRWTERRKALIKESRVKSTRTLAEALALLRQQNRLRNPLPLLMNASAVGYYGDAVSSVANEDSPAGSGFLSEVALAWEAATQPAILAGLRVMTLRLGVVLSAEGGMLAKILPAFKLGLGGAIGSGDQWMSWIAIEDVVRAIFWLMVNPMSGPINLVSPQPLTNRQFSKTLGEVLHRPVWATQPAWIIKAILGEMGETLLLGGQRVMPSRLLASGFAFSHPTLHQALGAILKRV